MLRMVGEVPLSKRDASVDVACLMWLRDTVVLVPHVLYVVTPVHTWYVDGTRHRSVFKVRRLQRYGASLGHMISRIGMEDVCHHWCEDRAPARTVGVYSSSCGERMIVPWINGVVESRRRGAPAPPTVV